MCSLSRNFKSSSFFYVTTADGPISNLNCGYDYLKNLPGNIMGFSNMDYAAAWNLDVIGCPVEDVMQKTEIELREKIRSWMLQKLI